MCNVLTKNKTVVLTASQPRLLFDERLVIESNGVRVKRVSYRSSALTQESRTTQTPGSQVSPAMTRSPPPLLERVLAIFTLSFLHFMSIALANASTDFVSAYYQIYDGISALDTANTPILVDQDVPDEVTAKLQPFGLRFDALPGLLQRALLWSGGYVFGDGGALAEIYTRCDTSSFGATMDDLALETQQVQAAGCDVGSCSTNDSTTIAWGFSADCGPSQIDDIVRCASASVKSKSNAAPVWATGVQLSDFNKNRVPEPLLRRHTWSNSSAGRSAILFAIHTDSDFQDVAYSAQTCSSETAMSSLIIPCIEYRASDDRWCRPKNSSMMTKWLDEYVNGLSKQEYATKETASDSSSSDKNAIIQYDSANSAMDDTNVTRLQRDDTTPGDWHQTVPVLIVGAAALLVTAVAVVIYLRRRSDQKKVDLQNSAAHQLSLSSTRSYNIMNSSAKPRKEPVIDREDVFGNPHSMHDFLEMLSSSPTAWESSPLSLSLALTAESLASGSPSNDKLTDRGVLTALANDPQLKHAQIPFDSLQFHHLIARGGHTEVWLCVLHDRCVTAKRLSKEQRKSWSEVKAFVRSIRLSAALQHPSILSFVGVAWSSLQNLCLLTEYLELGDLREYLRQSNPNRDQAEAYEDFMCFSLSWKREKMQILLDIARGLVYLHHHSIVHGDVKAKNVLLSATVDAKLAGFGTPDQYSADTSNSSQRGGRTPPLWTAPEVLAGGSLSEKADIYSLGVLITELDTHRSPYADSVTARGERMPPLQVLQHVISDQLKPSLSSTCPDEIVDLAERCLDRDPSSRPSSRDVVQALRIVPGFNLDEFSL